MSPYAVGVEFSVYAYIYVLFSERSKESIRGGGHGVRARGSEATAALLGSGYNKDTCVRLLFATNVISTSVISQGTLR